MIKTMFRSFVSFSFLALVALPLWANAEELAPADELRIRVAMRTAGTGILEQGTPGAAIAVVYQGHVLFESFGTNGLNRDITPHTLFEIGSNTKTFTTTLLGLDIARGRLNAQDQAQDFLPDITLSPEMESVTLGQLADFTSSLPDLPPEVRGKPTTQRGINFFSVADYFDFIQNWEPSGRLPANYLYSNSSVGLLGYCLVQDTTEKGIERWSHRVRQEILNPLKMRETTPWPNASQQDRVSAGFLADGKRAPVWPLQAWAAAGALRSSSSDLSKYLSAYLGETPVSSKLKRAMRIATKPRYSVTEGGERFDQALAWTIHEVPTPLGRRRLILKDGGTAGFTSALAFNRESGIGIVVLINQAGQQPVEVATSLFQDLVEIPKDKHFVTANGTLVYTTVGGNVYTVTGATVSGGVIKVGGGTLNSGGSNTYSGVTTVSGGTLGGTLTVPSGGILFSGSFNPQIVVNGGTVTVNGRPVILQGTITSTTGTLILNGVSYPLTGHTLVIGNGEITLDGVSLGAFPPPPPETEIETETADPE